MSVVRDDDHNPFGPAVGEKKRDADPFDPNIKPLNDPFAVAVEEEVEDEVAEEIGSQDA